MDGKVCWWITIRNIGLPPLARVKGVCRQQQWDCCSVCEVFGSVVLMHILPKMGTTYSLEFSTIKFFFIKLCIYNLKLYIPVYVSIVKIKNYFTKE